MTQKEILVRVAAIITALDDTKGSPESMLYIFMDMDMDKWQIIRGILITAKLIKIEGYFVTLTELGLEMAKEIKAKLSCK
jgi:predicted methyltransferase